MNKMLSYYRHFPSVFKPVYNMEICFRNNFRYFGQRSEEINPYLKKYANKIATFQNSNPEEFKKRSEKSSINSSKRSQPPQTRNYSNTEHQINNIPHEPQPSFNYSGQNKKLNDIVKIDLLFDKSAEDIEVIWMEYHKNKSGLYAVLPRDAFKSIISTAQECPTFVLPLPKHRGYEFIMCQFSRNSFFFTTLSNFQILNQQAPACLTITYYDEFQENKGIVLMRGEFDENTLKPHEAQCLSNELQLYYGGKDQTKTRLLWNFNKNPTEFNHMELIAELETVK